MALLVKKAYAWLFGECLECGFKFPRFGRWPAYAEHRDNWDGQTPCSLWSREAQDKVYGHAKS